MKSMVSVEEQDIKIDELYKEFFSIERVDSSEKMLIKTFGKWLLDKVGLDIFKAGWNQAILKLTHLNTGTVEEKYKLYINVS